MAESDDLDPDEDFLKQMDLLKGKLENKRSTVVQTDIVNASFRILMKIYPQFMEMKSYGKDLNDLKNENKELKNRILEIEIEKSSECVIIKNLPPKKTKNKENETQVELKENFQQILKEMKVQDQIRTCDIFRLKPKAKAAYGGKCSFSPVKVRLGSRLDRGLFMANLKKLQNGEFKEIKVGIDVPKELLELHKELDLKAFEFRNKFPGSKTKIAPNKLTLVLLTRKKNEDKFTEIVEEY